MTTSVEDLAAKAVLDADALGAELREIEMLVSQAETEAGRHEQKRSQASDKLVAATAKGDPKEVTDLANQVVTLTRRAAVMEAQVQVLEGKRKALARHRDAVRQYADALTGVDTSDEGSTNGTGTGGNSEMSPAVSRVVLSAQEDLRREIARAMHDGPAQSLTNIVLQAQIVERLVGRDPDRAHTEVGLLVSMVQHTLDATKNFIFDVRPMVLDDLGIVPTLRRAARERGRRAGVPVAFDSVGQDRRLPAAVESGLFRILDETIAGFLSSSPERVTVHLDWRDDIVDARVAATRSVVMPRADDVPEAAPPEKGKELPPALVAMIEAREEAHRDAVSAAEAAAVVQLPPRVVREIEQRAAMIGAAVTILPGVVETSVSLPAETSASDQPAAEA